VPGQLLGTLIAENITVIVTDYILEELRGNINEKFKSRELQRVIELLEIIMSCGVEVLRADAYERNLPVALEAVNLEDAPILAAAMLPEVTYFVTGDSDFLENSDVHKILSSKLIRASDLLNQLRSSKRND